MTTFIKVFDPETVKKLEEQGVKYIAREGCIYVYENNVKTLDFLNELQFKLSQEKGDKIDLYAIDTKLRF